MRRHTTRMRGIQYAAALPRHCERSEAIHKAARKVGLLRRVTPRNDGSGSGRALAFSRRDASEAWKDHPRQGGCRECRVRAAPAVSCARCTKKCAHEHTGSAEALRHSLRSGLTAYIVLSPATNSSCHRRRRISGSSRPGRVSQTSADLTPATGARTTRFCRTQKRRSSARPDRSRANRPAITSTRPTLPRPPHPIPTFVTMANAPLSGTG